MDARGIIARNWYTVMLKCAVEISSKTGNTLIQWAVYYCKPAILPILLAIIPALYHYSNNVENLTHINLFRILVLNTLLGVIIYLVFTVFMRSHSTRAANAAFVFLIFFVTTQRVERRTMAEREYQQMQVSTSR